MIAHHVLACRLATDLIHIYLYHIAYPTHLLPSQIISVIQGSNITLPCYVERPFLNNYTVTWTANGESITLPSDVFDLQLANVPLSYDNRVYTCSVETSIDQPETGADATTTITLTVTLQHSKNMCAYTTYMYQGYI